MAVRPTRGDAALLLHRVTSVPASSPAFQFLKPTNQPRSGAGTKATQKALCSSLSTTHRKYWGQRGAQGTHWTSPTQTDADPNPRSPDTWCLLRLLRIPNARFAPEGQRLCFSGLTQRGRLSPRAAHAGHPPGPREGTSALSPQPAQERNRGSGRRRDDARNCAVCLPRLGQRSRENEEDWSAAERRAIAQRKRKRRGAEARGSAGGRPLSGLDRNRMYAPA